MLPRSGSALMGLVEVEVDEELLLGSDVVKQGGQKLRMVIRGYGTKSGFMILDSDRSSRCSSASDR